jgi:hypothetical protein
MRFIAENLEEEDWLCDQQYKRALAEQRRRQVEQRIYDRKIDRMLRERSLAKIEATTRLASLRLRIARAEREIASLRTNHYEYG